MQRASLSDLTAEAIDVLVIGGGIYGAMVARDAALRGLRTALVEARDFGGGASHNSLKLMHGGIRYVQHLDFSRLRASARERAFWQVAAPDLVRPLEFAIPLTGYGTKGPEAFRAASMLYNLASAGLRGAEYPGAGVVGGAEARRRLGEFAPDDLRGAGVWRDGQILDANRLQIAVVRAAVEAGALAANHMEARALIRSGASVTGARLRDTVAGEEAEVRAGVTVVCAGAATAALAGPVLPEAARDRFPGFARATNIVIDRPATERALGVVSRSRSDAVIDRGARLYFLTPWQGRLIVGTHEHGQGGRDIPPHGTEDVQDFLQEIAVACPSLQLGPRDVLYAYQGLIPADVDDSRSGVRRQTRGTLIDHAAADGVGGLITSVGVKYTTARLIAERSVDFAAAQVGRGGPSQSVATPLPADGLPKVDPDDAAGLAAAVRASMADAMAITLPDVVLRRLSLGETGALRGPGGAARLEAAARTMAQIAGWSDARMSGEIAAVRADPGLAGHLGPQ